MSEYIEFEIEQGDDPALMCIRTNLRLTEEAEELYDSPAAMELGSPLAQMLAPVEGVIALRIAGYDLYVTGNEETPWHMIVPEITATVREFFL